MWARISSSCQGAQGVSEKKVEWQCSASRRDGGGSSAALQNEAPYLSKEPRVLLVVDVGKHLLQRRLEPLLRRSKLGSHLLFDFLRERCVGGRHVRRRPGGWQGGAERLLAARSRARKEAHLLHLSLLVVVPQAARAHVHAEAPNGSVSAERVDLIVSCGKREGRGVKGG